MGKIGYQRRVRLTKERRKKRLKERDKKVNTLEGFSQDSFNKLQTKDKIRIMGLK